MGFKKYARKQARRAGKYLKKRYVPGGKLDIAKIASDVMKLKGVLNTERKFSDATMATSIAIQGVDTAPNWNLYFLQNISQGDAVTQRHGVSVRFKSVQLKGDIEQASDIAPPQRVRMILFVDKEPLTSGAAGTDPALNQLFQDNSINGMRNWDSILQRRFSILHSRIINLSADRPNYTIDLYKKLNMVTKWTSAGTVGDLVQNNALYVAFISSENQAQTARPLLTLRTRLTFVDN